MIASASLPSAHIASNTSLAILPEMVLSAMRASRPASARRRCGSAPISRLSLLSAAARDRPSPSWRRAWPAPPRLCAPTVLVVRGQSRGSPVSTPASYADRPYCAAKRAAFWSGSSGSVAAHGLDERLVEHDRQQVRIGEVAVVVRLFLGAHRARLALVGVVEARFLHDLAAALEQLDLALDLVVDGLLDEAERIEVLDLGARAELRLRRPAAPTRWRRSGTSLPACCRRRCSR